MNGGKTLTRYLPPIVAAIAAAVSLLWFWASPNRGVRKVPKVMGHREGCLVCHLPMSGFEKAHDPNSIGCFSCHLGNPFTMNKSAAHKGMVLIPGNLDYASRTCGTSECHPLLSKNINTSLMASGRGLVSVDRYVFGETAFPNDDGHLSKLGDSPAQDHLRKLCASCHLAKPKTQPAPISQISRGGGCTACHLSYSPEASAALEEYKQTRKPPKTHPSLTIRVTKIHCFGCHSRSGRISTNYEGWHETRLSPHDVTEKTRFRVLEDGRVFTRISPDIHFARGMECIDCHTWREAMGNGKQYFHEEEQVEISCEDCHPLRKPATLAPSKLEGIDQNIVKRREALGSLSNVVLTSKTKRPLLNVTVDIEGQLLVIGKNSGKVYHPKAPAPVCSNQIPGHRRLTCQSCHTPWAPSCIQCHTSYDKEGRAVDHVTGKQMKGRWIEKRADMFPRQPSLGVKVLDGKEKVDTFIPGMILTIDLNGYPDGSSKNQGKIFRRLYAPTSAHTTSEKGLECQSCHIDGVVMGLGEGLFSIKQDASSSQRVIFRSLFAKRDEDGLPQDAWTGLWSARAGMVSTRLGARPLSPTEQVRVLRVGVCLICHRADDKGIDKIYEDFESALGRLTPRCRLPDQLSVEPKTPGK